MNMEEEMPALVLAAFVSITFLFWLAIFLCCPCCHELQRASALTGILMTLVPAAGEISGHQPVKVTWLVTNLATGRLINTTTVSGSINDAYPNLTVDLCAMAEGYSTDQSWNGCEDWIEQKHTHKEDFYVCPGTNRTQSQINNCGGVADFYCKNWGCETTGVGYWIKHKGPIKMKKGTAPRVWGHKKGEPTCDEYNCVPYIIEFTEEGKRSQGWDTATMWGLRLYLQGHDFGVIFSILRKVETISGHVDVGP